MKISKKPKIKSMRFVFLTLKSGLIIPLLFCYSLISAQEVKLGTQGILKSSNGVAVANGNYSLTFRIYDVAEGGTALWTETQASVPVNSGLYNTVLGSINPLNLTFSTDYYVGVSVGSTPEMLPRLQLSTAPYALSVRGSSNTFPNTGAVGIGTTSPTAGYQLHLKNGIGSAAQLVEGTTGAGLTFVKGTAITTLGLGNTDHVLRLNPNTAGTIFQRNNADVMEVNNSGMSVTGIGTFSNGLTVSSGTATFGNISFSGNSIDCPADLNMKFHGSTKLTVNTEGVTMPGHLSVTGTPWDYYNSGRIAYYGYNSGNLCQNKGCNSEGNTTPASINCNNRVRATEFNSYSDRRIKTNILLSDKMRDLEILQNLQVTNYRHRDFISKGTDYKKGFIAQDVEKVYPEAVKITTDFLPDIYQYAVSKEMEGVNLSVTLADSHQLKAGDKVQVLFPGGQKEYVVGPITNNNTLTLVDWGIEKPEWLFVYGKQVDDFRQVDYDRIHTLNVSVTQELIRSMEALESEIAALKNENNKLMERRDRLDVQVTKLESAVSNQQASTKDKLPAKPEFSTISGF